jgi:hypothetical protein
MKTKGLILAFVAGMLASTPAYAWTWNSATYASRFRPVQPAPSTVAKPQPAAGQSNSDVQVAVMAKSPSQQTAGNSGGDKWFGTDQRSRATHSH